MRLTLKVDGDWCVIERAEHDGRMWTESMGPNSSALRCSSRFSDADVEGTKKEMLAIAKAIEERSAVDFRRCAVRVDGERVFFESPRNSMTEGECSLTEADELAVEIRAKLIPWVRPAGESGGGR